MTWPIVTMAIEREADIVAIRQRARRLAELLGFDRQSQTRIATAVSEIARNALTYGRGGRADFILDESDAPQVMLIRISDKGPGIADLAAVLEGRYQSPVGMGVGITGARRLLDHFRIESGSAGTVVELGQRMPYSAAPVTRDSLAAIVRTMNQDRDDDPLVALRQQNQELMQSLEEVQRRQDESSRLTSELNDTNRGVVALYAELDERAEQLRIASETKSRFLSNMSHEFRTPLNSIMALSRLLLDAVDGDLNDEQRRQLGYIRKSAQDLLDLVNDLLDLAKVEAGKVDVRPVDFRVGDLFSTLRGALKPLRDASAVELIFDSTNDIPDLWTDEGKVAQILRNFISNALKFTERGNVHVSAHYDPTQERVVFVVADTGIGIAPADQECIFEEFHQVPSGMQERTKGTGLGLPLSRRLAELLHGEIWVESEPGIGSRFYLNIPRHFALRPTPGAAPADAARKRVLLIDDDETFRYVLRQIVIDQPQYEFIEAIDGEQGLECVRESRPDLVVLDLHMPKVDGFEVLRNLRADPATDRLPIIISTSQRLDADLMAQLPEGTPVLAKNMISRQLVTQMFRDAMSRRDT